MTLASLRIFISYPHSGAAHSWAKAVHAHLENLGVQVWRDETGIQEGEQNWCRRIEDALLHTDLVVAVIGKDSQVCHWQSRELLNADKLGHPIVPLRIANVPLPFCIQEKQPVEDRGNQGATLAALVEAAHFAWQQARRLPLSTWDPGVSEEIPPAQRRDEIAYIDDLTYRHLSDREERYVALEGRERRSLFPERAMKSVRIDTHALFQAFGVAAGPIPKADDKTYEDVLDAYRDLNGRKVRQLAVLGEPGAGKSFSLERIAVYYGRRAREDSRAPIPLLVALGLWTRDGESLEGFISRNLDKLGRHFSALLDQRRTVLLLDGINEIPPGQRRFKAAQIQTLAQDKRFTSVVVSCREKDFGEFSLPFDTLTLQPLTPPRIQEFLRRVFLVQGSKSAEAEADIRFWQIAGGEQAATLRKMWEVWRNAGIEHLFWTDDDIRWKALGNFNFIPRDLYATRYKPYFNPRSLIYLAANPYLLQILAILPEIPTNRSQLFHGFLEVLYKREVQARAARHDERRPPMEAWLAALTQLAEVLQKLGENESYYNYIGAQTVLPKTEWPAVLNADMLDFSRDANVLDLQDGNLRFTHQLLQEYLASRLLLKASLGERPASDFWPPERWWERNGWEVVAEIAIESCEDIAPKVSLIAWLGEANPQMAAEIWCHANQPPLPLSVLGDLSARWLHSMTDPEREPQSRARAAIGWAMGRFGLDNRPGVGLRSDGLPDIDWITISGPEPFTYQENIHPGLPTYDLARYPVTHSQFQAFINAGGYQEEQWWSGLALRVEAPLEASWNEPNSPRETLSWYEAVAFCRWLSAASGEAISLPTEEQWERASRGLKGREYPWGEFQSNHANCENSSYKNEFTDIHRTSAVGLYPQGASEDLLLDLAGNVWEWCLNEYHNPDKIGIYGDQLRILRGGSWFYGPYDSRSSYRYYNSPEFRGNYIGFRVCRTAPSID